MTMTVDDIRPWNDHAVRSRFPALARNAPPIYADAPGGTQVPSEVIDAMVDYLSTINSNIEGEFDATRQTDALIHEARADAAALVGGDPEGIAFGQNMTTLNFNLVRAVGRTLTSGDEIIVTQLDHEANVSPWLLMAQDRDLTVRTIPLTTDLDIDLDVLASTVGSRTRVVAFTLASNAVGTVTKAREIADMAHAHGALAWMDGVAFTPHRLVDVNALGSDVLLLSPYKVYGPHLGVGWIRPELAESLPAERVRPASLRPLGHRFETGTLSHEAIAGFRGSIDYLTSLGTGSDTREQIKTAFMSIQAHEAQLVDVFLQGLADIPTVHLVGRAGSSDRVATFGLRTLNVSPEQAARHLDAHGIYAWNGNFYAQGVMEALGVDPESGILRLGFAHYNTLSDVQRCLEALRTLKVTG